MKNIEISEKDFADFRENVLKPCLKKNKSVFKTVDYSMENFNTLFPRSRIETPLESVKFGKGQFSKFSLRERRNLISAVYETLTKPDIVLQEERPGEFDEAAISHNYAKNFAMDKDSKMIQSVVVEIEDENVIITSHERPVNEIVSKIKQADQILYIAPEIGSLIRQHTQNEQSVSHQFLGETLQGRTSSLNKSYSYSEEKSIENLLSEGKLTNKDVLRYGEAVGIKAVQKVNYILRKDNKPELDENIFKDASLEELMKCIGDSYGYPEEATNKRKHIAFQTLNRAKVVFEKYSEYITRKVVKENEMNKSEQQKMDRISKELASSVHNIRKNETEDSNYSMNFDNSVFGLKADESKEYRLNISFDGYQVKNYSIDCVHIENGIVSDIDYDIHKNFDERQIKLLEEAKSGISKRIKEYEQKKDISEKTVNDYDAENFKKRYDAIGSTRNFIKEKLSAAGIEIVSDKAEFDRILDSAEILQKMQKENKVEKLFVSVNNENLDSEIDKVTINDVNLKDDFIEISKETPFILKECGLNDFPVNMYKQKLARALFLEEQKFGERITHGHKGEFTEKDVKDVFRNISNPRYIFNSKNNISNPNDYYLIAVYDNLDVNKDPMVLSFHFNKNRKEVEANWVTSIYGKRKEILVNDWTKKGFLIYMNDLEMEKAPAEVVTLQMRVSKSASAYINNINLKSKIVNDLDIAFYKQNSLVYGFAYEGKIYLNPEIATSEVALHEYTHLWDNYTQRTNPELWQKGKDIFKNTHFWNDVKSDPNYADIANNEDLLLSEVHAQLCGKMADEILTKIAERDGELTRNSVIDWDKETWSYIKKEILSTLDIELNDLVLMRDFLSMPMKDLMSGKNISIEKELYREKLIEEAKLNEIVIPPYSREKRDIEIIRDFLAKIENVPANQIEDKMVFAIIDNIGKDWTQAPGDPGDFLKIRKDGSVEHISALGSVEKEPIKVLDIIKSFAENHAAVSDEGSQQRKDYEYVVHLQESKKWDLIEKNYPDFETSKAITLSNDIAMWDEGQNEDFKTVEQFNEREGSFFKSREEILEFGNKLDEQLYKTAYAYMNHMETDELEVSEAMAEKNHEEQKEITVTHSVTFPCGFTFPKEIENDYGKKEEYRWKVFEELKVKYGFNENDAETMYFDDKVSPENDSFNINFAAPVPNDIKKSKEMVEKWIKNIEKDLTENYGAFINWQGGERLEEKYSSMEGFEMKREENPITESEKSQVATALDVMNYLYSNGDTVEQDVADEIIRIFGERSENLFKDSDGSISILKGNEIKRLSPKELCEQSISDLNKRLESQNLSYLEKEALESYKNKLNVFAEENLEKYITVSPDKAYERLVELGLEISEECVEAIVSEMDKKWAEEIVENSKGELLWHDKEGEKGYRYDALDASRLEMLVANTLDSLGDWKERPENKSASETEISRHDSMIKALSKTSKSMKLYANLDNAFEIARRTVDVKQPFNGKNYSAAEKGMYILEAVERFSENAPESLNHDFEILLKGKDSVENGIDSLGFVRPDSEQMKIGLENGWDFEEACKGYIIAGSDELPDGVEVIQRIDDMGVFDSDEAAAIQAQADGVKIIPSYKLSFSNNDPMSYYSYVDSPENRELLKDYILSEAEMALNIEIDWFKDRTGTDYTLPEQLKDSAQKFDEENLKKWNNLEQPYSVLLTDDITGNHLLVEVRNSLYSTYLFDSSGKFIEEFCNFTGYREKPGSDIFIDITSSIEAGIITMDDYQKHNLWGDFHKFHINRNKELKENLITVKTDLFLYDKKMWQQRREYATDYSESKFLGHILAEAFCTADFKPEVWSYLLKKGADIDETLKTVAADANLGDNLKWLIENAPEQQWERIKNNSSFCREVMDIAEKSIANDEEFSVNPMLSLSEKIGMEAECIRYCNSLIKEYGEKYELSALKDSLNRFTQKDAGRVKAKIAEITSMSFEEAADSKNVDEKSLAKEFAELLNEKDRIEHPDKEERKHFTADFILCELEKGSSYGQIMAEKHPGVSFFDDKEKMRDFQNMSEKEFLKSYSYLSKSDYQVTKSVLAKNVYAVSSNIYDALLDAEKSVYTGKELKELGIAVRFICNISAGSEFSADTLRKEFPEVWNDTDILRIQSDFNADGVMQQPVYLIHFDKDMNEVSSMKMDSLSPINNVQLKRKLADHFNLFVNKNYDMSVREAFDLEPKPGKVFTTDDAKDFAEILNSYRNSSSEPEISEEIAGCIIEYLEYEDYRVYLEKEKGNLCLYDNSEDYTGHGEIQTVKDIVEFAMEMAYKAKELEYDVYSPESFEKIKNLNDAYNDSALSAKLSDKLLRAASDDERQAIYMEHYGIGEYAVSRKDNILTYYVPARTDEERFAGYPVKATVNLLSGKESRISVTEKECHDAHEQYMLENIGRRYVSRIKDLLPENERKSVESVLKAGKLAMKDFSDDDKKYISQFMKNLGATDGDSLGKALNKAVTPISEQKREKSLKGYEERGR